MSIELEDLNTERERLESDRLVWLNRSRIGQTNQLHQTLRNDQFQLDERRKNLETRAAQAHYGLQNTQVQFQEIQTEVVDLQDEF